MAFNVKYNDLGQVDKFKCRMLVNGMRAIPNLHFDKKFAQASTLASIRLQLAMAIQEGHIFIRTIQLPATPIK